VNHNEINPQIIEQPHEIMKNGYRRQLLSKKLGYVKGEESDNSKQRDTKNVVKNIIRLFQGWLEEHIVTKR